MGTDVPRPASGWGRLLHRPRLGLRTRLLSVLAVTVVVSLGVLWFSSARMTELAEQSRDAYVSGTVPVDALRTLQVAWWEYRAESALAEAAVPGSDDQAGHQYATDRAMALVRGQQAVVDTAALSPDARTTFEDFRTAAATYVQRQDDVRQLRRSQAEVPAGAEAAIDDAAGSAADFLDRATAQQVRAASTRSAESAADLAAARRSTTTFVALALALAVLCTYLAVRSVTRPLRELRRALGRIGDHEDDRDASATDGDPDADLLLGLSRDVAVVEAAQRADRVFRRTVEEFPFAVLLVDADARLHHANAEAQRLLALPTGAGRTQQAARVHEPHRQAYLDALTEALAGRDARVEVDVLGVLGALGALPGDLSGSSAGPRRRCAVSFVPLGEDAGALLCFTDITESTSLHRELLARAERDPLTGCANRTTVLAHLSAVLAERGAAAGSRAADDHADVGLLFLDLDGFKAVNDSHGHGAGDLLLVHVARTLAGLVRPGDLVGRLGGDEFLVVLSAVAGEAGAEAAAARVRSALEGPVTLQPAVVPLRVSTGAVVARVGEAATDLVGRADAAMYADKRARRATRAPAGPPVVLSRR